MKTLTERGARFFFFFTDLLLLPLFVAVALGGRTRGARRGIGFGPDPLINNIHHAKALRRLGFDAESIGEDPYFITSDFDRVISPKSLPARFVSRLIRRSFWTVALNYAVLFTAFTGGPLRGGALWRLEPWFMRIAGVKIIILPFGGDVQDLRRCQNLEFIDAVAKDYPEFFRESPQIAKRVALWQRHASAIYSGCDWVDYMTYWDTLQVGHFSVDTLEVTPTPVRGASDPAQPLRVLHAPNHRAIKGTASIVKAVEELRLEGYDIDLQLLEGVPNELVQEAIRESDLVVDQLIIGWYAMFALEAMSHGRPVICHIEPRYRRLYVNLGLIAENDPPLIEANPQTIKDVLRELSLNRSVLQEVGSECRDYAERLHSFEVVGREFAATLGALGVVPTNRNLSAT